MLSNRQLESILENLSEIPHLARIRFCTYSVIKTPERVDDGFLAMLRRFQDRFSIRMVLHVMHPQQLDESTKRSVLELLKAGAPSFSQVPLLKGVNIFDDIEKSRSLLREFVRSLNDQRIQPYYFVVKLAVPGTTYFAMPLEKIVEIFRPLLQHDQDLTGMETTFRLMAAAPQTKVFLYPETKFEYDKTRGGYIIFSEGEEIFYPYEDLEKA